MKVEHRGNKILYDGKTAPGWAQAIDASTYYARKIFKENSHLPLNEVLLMLEKHSIKPNAQGVVRRETPTPEMNLYCFHAMGGFKTRLTPSV